jgi:hypothetical protein
MWASEEPLADDDRIAGTHGLHHWHGTSVRPMIDDAREICAAFECARREAACDGDGGFDGHPAHEWILTGRRDFTQDKERPEGFDFDGNARLAQKAVAEL